ncbi:GNAT family N-acetyltransferase [Arthrobacter sp. MYb227]|uniref:GNAT family N-acetyltransferase n=1 Tax=Arthrobacter sp. MYb227 TaxID=1848601 RepID=UPI0015E2F30E|nr:GNAT family protein [Arthrobacter sp. MYb227]
MTNNWNIGDAVTYGTNVLCGDKIRFRALAESDLPLLEKWWGLPEWSVLQQTTIRPCPAGSTAEMFKQWSINSTPGSIGLSIETRESGSFIGHVTLYGASMPERAATLAIILAPEETGKGYGTDAVKTAIDYGFLQMGLNRIELRVWAFNQRAHKAYSNAGFTEEGRLREVLYFNGTHHDAIVMSILRSEWKSPLGLPN